MPEARPNWRDVLEFLDSHPGNYTYEQVADTLRSHPKAVGAMMRAIHGRGLHQYCGRVVEKDTGRPAFDCSASP